MRKRLFQLLLTVILLTASVISLIIGRFSYDFVKTVLRDNMEEKILRIEKQLEHYQGILNSIEKNMDLVGGKALIGIQGELHDPANASKLAPETLKTMAKKFGVEEIYLINSEGRVSNSSLKSDINLNLLGISPSFTRYINSIYGRGEVISQGISVSIKEGKINHYMYYSPKGSRVIYEISMDVLSFVNQKYNFALYEFLFGDMFKNFYSDYLISIDIYSIAGGTNWSLVNPGKKFAMDKELVRDIVEKGEAVVEKDNRIYVYRKIKMNRYIFNRTTSVYVELIYDVSILSRYTRKIIIYSVFSCIFITAIIFLLSTMKMNDMFIRRMLNIIESLKKIKNGDYSISIQDDTGDELSDISSNINMMTRTIQQRTGEISRTNEQLKEMTTFINDIIDSMPSALISINEKDRITQWNIEAEKLSGVPAADAASKELWDIVPQLYKYRAKCEEVRQKRNRVELYGEDFIVERAGKEEIYVKNIYIFPFSRELITGVILRIDDVTELSKKEEQLDRAKKAEALGTMAGGLAHDFNNIISGIISTASYLDIVLSGYREPDIAEIQSHINIIRKSGEKAAGLVRNLMSFSKSNGLEYSRIDLRSVIDDVTGIAAPALKELDYKVITADGEALVSGNRTQLEQVLLNLIVNAAEAIKQWRGAPGGGSIRIELIKTSVGDKPLQSESGFLWQITVADNGPGVSKELQDRIFDPFFTTKKEGNGLGLAIVNTIITRHQGLIEVQSEKDSGTIFNIYLPAID